MSSEPHNDPANSCLDSQERSPFSLFTGKAPASQNQREEAAVFSAYGISVEIKEQAHEL